jgi:hypothetical protein
VGLVYEMKNAPARRHPALGGNLSTKSVDDRCVFMRAARSLEQGPAERDKHALMLIHCHF